METGPVEGSAAGSRHTGVVVVCLSTVAGATNALSFMRVGKVFASVMTGNVVLLGVSSGRQDASLAWHAGLTFLGYVLGTVIGARLSNASKSCRRRVWAARTLSAELGALSTVTILWELSGTRPDGALRDVMLLLAAGAMGLQSKATSSLPSVRASTTYFTGTLTGVLSALTTGDRSLEQRRGMLALGGLLAGAGIEAELLVVAPAGAPAVLLAGLVATFGLLAGWPRRLAPPPGPAA